MSSMCRARRFLAALLIICAYASAAAAQSSSGYPMPGCQIIVPTVHQGDAAGHVASLLACAPSQTGLAISTITASGGTATVTLATANAAIFLPQSSSITITG